MIPLNLPKAQLNLSRKGEQIFVFCPVRKKRLVLTPEEWVRQHIIAYFIDHIGISIGKITSEYSLIYNEMNRRADIVVMNDRTEPFIIVECKRPSIAIDQSTFLQAAEYKHILSAKYLILSNGLNHTVIDIQTGSHSNDINSISALYTN